MNGPPSAFTPTDAQRRLVNFIVANPVDQTLSQICEAANIGLSSYYRWTQDADFRAWLVQQWTTAVLFEGWQVLNVARAKMNESTAHFKVMVSLLFNQKGLEALTTWQDAAAAPAGFSGEPPAAQELLPANEKVSEPQPAPPEPVAPPPQKPPAAPIPYKRRYLPLASLSHPSPARVIRHLHTTCGHLRPH